MWNFSEIHREGDLWRVSEPLVNSLDRVLVTPKPFYAGPVNIANEPTVTRGYGIVVLGWTIHMVASGAATASIVARTPWITQGNTVDDPVHQYQLGAAGVITNSVNCVIPLTHGGYRFDSSPTSTDGASLVIKTTTGFTAGMLTIWGIHTQGDYGRYALTSSPADFT